MKETSELLSPRVQAFQRNDSLETLLEDLNALLSSAQQQMLCRFTAECESPPVVLVFGAGRTGSTLFMQWLAATGLFAYPSNLLSRFYRAPLVGAKIQRLLTDPEYAFRDELFDLAAPNEYRSANGKTRGALAPNEFWYFWRRFLPYEALDFLPNEQLLPALLESAFVEELLGLARFYEKPFAMKAMIMNQNIPVLDKLFERAVFVWLRRQPEYNIQSLLEARRRQYGRIDQWYSFKIREYPELSNLPPLRSVAGQIYHINESISAGLASLPEEKKLIVDYEDFCERPLHYFGALAGRLKAQGYKGRLAYGGPEQFKHTNTWKLNEYSYEEAKCAYQEFLNHQESL